MAHDLVPTPIALYFAMSNLLAYFHKRTASESSLRLPSSVAASERIRAAVIEDTSSSATQNQIRVTPVYAASDMTATNKADVVAIAESDSIAAAAIRYPGIPTQTIRRWVRRVKAAREEACRVAPTGARPLPVDPVQALHDSRTGNGRRLPQTALEAAFDRFAQLRDEGKPVSTAMLRQIVIAEVQKVQPDIVRTADNPMGWFTCSDHWIHEFKADNGLAKRRASTAKRGDIHDMEATRNIFLERVAFTVRKYCIPAELTYHADETGVQLQPSPTETLDFRGAKSVAIVGSGDKRQATCMLGGTVSGEVLKPQIIFKGLTRAVLPPTVDGVDCVHSESHWATYDTTCAWISSVIVPHAQAAKVRLGLQPNHPALLIWDVWQHHRSAEMMSFLLQYYPWLRVVFVPANCTSYLQVADVSMNKPFKDSLKQQFSKWLMDQDLGTKNTISVTVLRPLILQWILVALDRIRSIDAVSTGVQRIGLHTCFTAETQHAAMLTHQLGQLWSSATARDAVAVEGDVTRVATVNLPEATATPSIQIPAISLYTASEASSVAPAAGHKRKRVARRARCSYCNKLGHNRRTCEALHRERELRST